MDISKYNISKYPSSANLGDCNQKKKIKKKG